MDKRLSRQAPAYSFHAQGKVLPLTIPVIPAAFGVHVGTVGHKRLGSTGFSCFRLFCSCENHIASKVAYVFDQSAVVLYFCILTGCLKQLFKFYS